MKIKDVVHFSCGVCGSEINNPDASVCEICNEFTSLRKKCKLCNNAFSPVLKFCSNCVKEKKPLIKPIPPTQNIKPTIKPNETNAAKKQELTKTDLRPSPNPETETFKLPSSINKESNASTPAFEGLKESINHCLICKKQVMPNNIICLPCNTDTSKTKCFDCKNEISNLETLCRVCSSSYTDNKIYHFNDAEKALSSFNRLNKFFIATISLLFLMQILLSFFLIDYYIYIKGLNLIIIMFVLYINLKLSGIFSIIKNNFVDLPIKDDTRPMNEEFNYSKNAFSLLEPPKGITNAITKFNEIQSQRAEIFEEARNLFEKSEMIFIGAGAFYPKIIKIDQLKDFDKLCNKTTITFKNSDKWFFIGDIHGDFLALFSILEQIKKTPNFRICFLGDLVDLGPYSANCFALLLKTAIAFPGQILWITGDHDEGIRELKTDVLKEKNLFPLKLQKALKEINTEIPLFESNIKSASFPNWLNSKDKKIAKERAFAGKLFIDIVNSLPKAVLFPNKLLATHGGIPQTNYWKSLTNFSSLFENQKILNHFTNAKYEDLSKSNEQILENESWNFSHEDLVDFCKKMKDMLKFDSLIRGHDHVNSRFESSILKPSVTTINSYGFNFSNPSFIPENYGDIFYYTFNPLKGLSKKPEKIKLDLEEVTNFYFQKPS